jgi:hypothetical protein
LIFKAVPFLEVYNRDQVVEAGYKYKLEIEKLKQEINTFKVGTLQGDRIIEDAEIDPLINLPDSDDEGGQEMKGTYGAGKLS